jgi:hypothetical protein
MERIAVFSRIWNSVVISTIRLVFFAKTPMFRLVFLTKTPIFRLVFFAKVSTLWLVFLTKIYYIDFEVKNG